MTTARKRKKKTHKTLVQENDFVWIMDSGDGYTVTVKHPGTKQSPTLKNHNKTHTTELGGTILQTQHF